MQNYQVTCVHLKLACEQKNWDLLDKLLEIDNSQINDNALFNDTWGEWWGLLFQAIVHDSEDSVKVLLKYNANRDFGSWGVSISCSQRELAKVRNSTGLVFPGQNDDA